MTTLAAPKPTSSSLTEVLAERGDPMQACHDAPWLERFLDVPENASVPLAMSPLHPRATGSYGEQHFAWAKRELGVTYRWWQQLAIARQLEHDADGALVYPELIETGPRRIGKSVRLRGVSCWRTDSADLIGEKQLSMLVSKDLAVGKEIHRGSWRWAEKKGWKVTRLNGAQEIEKPIEESRWLLRADTAVYGYDISYGPVDEAWGVDPQSITDGLEPAMLERLWPQLHLTSTAHVRATSLMRRRLVAALRNADPNVLLLFWGAHPDADVSLAETWRSASPHWTPEREALIARKYAAALAGQDEPEFDDPDPVRGWAAQYLNVWPGLLESENGSIFPTWSQLLGEQKRPEWFAIAADVKQKRFVLAGAVDQFVDLVTPAAFSSPQVPVSEQARFVAEVARITRAVAIQEKGPAWTLAPDLEEAGVRVTPVTMDDFVQACADFEADVLAGTLTHGGQPELDAAVRAAQWRFVGDRRVISRKSADIPELEAAILAHFSRTDGVPQVWSVAEMVAQMRADQQPSSAPDPPEEPYRPPTQTFVPL